MMIARNDEAYSARIRASEVTAITLVGVEEANSVNVER
jgi:hypothetical protein